MPPCATRSPVIVANCGVLSPPFPLLEGRHRQPLPKIPGQGRGALLIGKGQGGGLYEFDEERLEAWLVPWRAGPTRSLVITLQPGTTLVVDVSDWPEPNDSCTTGSGRGPRDRVLRRAARVLELAPGAFSTEPSARAAYERLEAIWNDAAHERFDPLGDLLKRHARKLRSILDDLCSRPRAVLRTEHRMVKLQDARRIDAKTLRWLSAQPGRSTAERAGARQRVKAPKRYETIATLENQVLRAFASLTVREANGWLAGRKGEESDVKSIEAHQLRARRIEAALKARNVPEATPPVIPNFPLRFDQRYREIWRAWQELRAMNRAKELEWMWQDRTFMELLGLRAAMKLHEAINARAGAGTLAHGPVLRAAGAPSQGHYLNEEGIRCTLGATDSIHAIEFESRGHGRRLGAAASAGPAAAVWWNALDAVDASNSDVAVGELPWTHHHEWDARLGKWAARMVFSNGTLRHR